MKVTMTFKIPEEKDGLYYARHGLDFCSVLTDVDGFLRSKLKYHSDKLDQKTEKAYQEIRDKISEGLNDRNINLYAEE